jgi:hypothetical protein
MRRQAARQVLILAALAAGLALDFDFAAWQRTGPLSAAEAIVGRPMTPVSGAGVARRTTRRVVRRTTIYISTLPANCTTVVVNGATIHSCGSVYYQPYGNQYVQVDVQ